MLSLLHVGATCVTRHKPPQRPSSQLGYSVDRGQWLSCELSFVDLYVIRSIELISDQVTLYERPRFMNRPLQLLCDKLQGDLHKNAAAHLLLTLGYIPLAITQVTAWINRHAPRISAGPQVVQAPSTRPSCSGLGLYRLDLATMESLSPRGEERSLKLTLIYCHGRRG